MMRCQPMVQLLVDDTYSVANSTICPPPTHRPADLAALLTTVADRMPTGSTLMLAGSWARTYLTPVADAGGHPVATPVQHGAWSARVMDGDTWIRWTRGDRADRYTIWTCEVDALEPGTRDTPLISTTPMGSAVALWEWLQATGHPWHGVPGMTGNAMLVDGMGRGKGAPRWVPRSAGPWATGPLGDIERPYGPEQWAPATAPDGEFTHGYDLNLAYLSALQNCELPADELEHRPGKQSFDARRGGIWRVELAPWTESATLPDPAGYAPTLDDGTRWVTTPTLALVDQLVTAGRHQGYVIRESWTAPGKRVTRGWAKSLHQVIQGGGILATAARRVYKSTYSMWGRHSGLIRRPEWAYHVIALHRANLWRKVDGGVAMGHPLAAFGATDALIYRSAQSDWAAAAPPKFLLDPSGIKLGAFKPIRSKGESA